MIEYISLNIRYTHLKYAYDRKKIYGKIHPLKKLKSYLKYTLKVTNNWSRPNLQTEHFQLSDAPR